MTEILPSNQHIGRSGSDSSQALRGGLRAMIYSFGPFRLIDEILYHNAKDVHIEPCTADLLRALLESEGGVARKFELAEAVWSTVRAEPNLTHYISELRKKLDEFEPGARNWIETRHRIGYKYVGPTVTKCPHAVALPAFSLSSRPVRPARNIGRELLASELARACAAERDARHVLILGGPGLGKTTLARAVATQEEVRNRFGERCVLVRLENANSASALEKAVASSIDPDHPPTFESVLARLREAPSLCLLDSLEVPWIADRDAVEERLERLADVLVLLTTMQGGQPPGKVNWRQEHLDPLNDDQARQLFRNIAPRVDPADEYLDRFVEALGGLPLAIELVAMRAAIRKDLKEPWDEWCRLGAKYATRDPDGGGRLDSLARSIEFAVASPRLTDAGRRLFSLLGYLPGGISRADREALLPEAATRAADELLATGLANERLDRLDLLSPVREHARREHPPQVSALEKMRAHYMELLKQLGTRDRLLGGRNSFQRLGPEMANLKALVRALLEAEKLDQAKLAAEHLWTLARFSGRGTDDIFHEVGIACERADDRRGQADCAYFIGDLALYRSDEKAREYLRQALSLYTAVDDKRGQAECLCSLGEAALELDDDQIAERSLEEGRRLFREIGRERGEAECVMRLGDVALFRKEYDRARNLFEEALTLYSSNEVDRLLCDANCIQRLGDVALARNEYCAARRYYDEALPLYGESGSLFGEANCYGGRGDCSAGRGEYDHARADYEAALWRYRQVWNLHGERTCRRRLAILPEDSSNRAAQATGTST